jgi:hypothetical protein
MEEAWRGSNVAGVERNNKDGGGWVAEQAQQRAEDCVRALKYLGKKSDCARIVGETLSAALDENTTRSADASKALDEIQLHWDAGFEDIFASADVFVGHEVPFL